MPNPQGRNGLLPTPPDDMVKPHIEEMIQMGMSYPKIVTALRQRYDTAQYSLGLRTLKDKCKKWGIKRARGQGHSIQSISNAVEAARVRFPNAGMRDMRAILHHENGIDVSEKTVLAYMKAAHPAEVEARLRNRGGMVRKRFWAAGVNDIWTVDQHDKLKRFGLYKHVAIEPVSGYVLWLKIWWTNRNPRLIANYYCDAVQDLGAAPLITQSDRGSENNGIANAQTLLRQHYDATLAGTLQHKWTHLKGQNIKPEIFWSEDRRRWAPGFENLLEYGLVQELYDPGDYISRMTFFYVFIPYLQRELDVFRERYNLSKKRRDKNKILPHGPPSDIFRNATNYGWEDFKVIMSPAQVEDVRAQVCGSKDDPVFQLVPQPFRLVAEEVYRAMGEPLVDYGNIWDIYIELLVGIQSLADDHSLRELEEAAQVTEEAFEGPPLPVLPLAPYRPGSSIGELHQEQEAEEAWSSDESATRLFVPNFTDDEEEA